MSNAGPFYSTAAWQKARAKILAKRPICEAPACSALSARVDHRKPISQGGSPLDPANLQALCARCHNVKTARVDGGFGRAPRPDRQAWGGSGTDGRPLDPGHHWNKR